MTADWRDAGARRVTDVSASFPPRRAIPKVPAVLRGRLPMEIRERSGPGFPIALGEADPEPEALDVDRPLAGRQAVVVDDHPIVLASVAGYLASAGCAVVAFTSFADAKSHLGITVLDILVTELRLGAFNGLQLVGRAKSRWPDTTAVVFSGVDDPVLRREAEMMGAAFLLKPLTRAAIIGAVMNH
jgi:CheY-like chemotaxis protein